VQATAVVALHFALGNVGDPMRDVPWLGVGVIAASPLARWLRLNLGERRLMQALAIGLVFVAARTAWAAR
ncbi:MAG TPA: hypothetical protein VMQ65_09645, partial [Candidatus Limnocylindria bacterium]|nr:hypothetical protein [Candidatus Limnocylindria bacterium]